MRAVILSGVPGSGKSTHAATLPGVIVSADTYFLDSNAEYKFDPGKLPAAHGACMKAFVEWCRNGNDVICDNTNTTAVEIAPYYAVAAAYGYQVEIVTFYAPKDKLPLCAERNRHSVPLKSIQRMAENIDRRHLPHYWNHKVIQASF